MKIKTLNLFAFGKFRNKTIEVSDGFNLIFGRNEAGKSTIQHFIEGMFFGFYKPYRKKRTYNENYYHYKPRNSDKYYGSLIMEDDAGRDIRIERDFLKTRDGVRIFDNTTGEEITETFPYDNVCKQYMPLGYGSINSVIYNNTVNFKQMASRSDADLAKEVNNRLVDMVSDNPEDVSVNGILSYLRDKKDAVGTQGKSKSNYGAVVRERTELQGKLEEAEKVYQRVRRNQKRIQQYNKKIQQLESQNSVRDQELAEQQKQDIEKTKQRISKIREEGMALEQQLADAKKQSTGFDPQVYTRLQYLESSIEGIAPRISKIQNEIIALSAENREVDKRCAHLEKKMDGLTLEKVEGDYREYEMVKANPGLCRKAGEMGEDAAAVRGNIMDFRQFPLILVIVLCLLGAVLIAVALANPADMFPRAMQITVSFFGLLLLLGSLTAAYIRQKQLSGKMTLEEEAPREKVEGDDGEKKGNPDEGLIAWRAPEEIISSYGKKNAEEYETLIKKFRTVFNRYEGLKRQSAMQKMRLEDIAGEQKSLTEESEGYRKELAEKLEDLGVDSVESYAMATTHQTEMDRLKAEIDANKRLYRELAGRDYIKVPAHPLGERVFVSPADGEKGQFHDAVDTYKHEMSVLQGENTTMMNGVENPVAIKERIENLDRRIEAFETELKACDMAEAFFMNYKKETHYDQATDLNEKIGGILQMITGKYSQVKVDDRLQVKVVNPEGGELLRIDQLSGGTIDQIYFALRFGVRDIVDRNKVMPFILDDPFVQYDDVRKVAALKYLYGVSDVNQVLLFTCGSDEKHIMDDNEMEYMGIGL